MKYFPLKTIATAAIFGAISVTAIAAPEANWLTTVAETEQGGFVMGNPDAPTKLIEYASYTCGHCANFEANEAPKIKSEKVASGEVSFEIRTLVRDVVDLTTAMLARCGGKDNFFADHEFFMANQANIGARTKMVTKPTIAKLQSKDFIGFMVSAYGEMKLGELMEQRGISDTKAKACLADKPVLARMLATSDAAGPTYNINATPSFVINGKYQPGAYDYATIEPLLTPRPPTE